MGLRKVVDNTKMVVHKTTDFIGITNQTTKSRYQYSEIKFYFIFLGFALMSVLSLFMLLPYAYYRYCLIKYNNSFYDNKKIRFNGTIRGAYTSFLSGFLLTIIILLSVDIIRTTFFMDLIMEYVPERFVGLVNTVIAALPTILASSLIFNSLFKWGQRNANFVYDDTGSYLEKKIIKGILVAILGKIFSLISFGLGNPLTVWIKWRFIVNREYVSHKKMKFDAFIVSSYKWFVWRYYLNIITVGFYYPIYIHKINQWTIRHSHIKE